MPEPPAASWLAAIVESSDDAIVSKTLEGTITSWNPAAERLFGYTAEEVIGRPISILAPPDRENEMPANLERIRRGEKVDRYETVRRRKDGSLVDISLTVSPIRDGTGRIVGASIIARDITARKQAEERQRLLTAELSHRVKNLFAVVQVLAERSASKATSAAECIEAFRGRLQALNAAHNALICRALELGKSTISHPHRPGAIPGRWRPHPTGCRRPAAQSGFRADTGSRAQ